MDPAGNARVNSTAGHFFQQAGAFSLRGIQKGSKTALCQQDRPLELLKIQSSDIHDTLAHLCQLA